MLTSMCSQRMENYQGDLTDIIRATGSIVGGGGGDDACNAAPVATADTSSSEVPEWRFPTDPINYSAEDFGDPFGHLRDPLLNNIDTPVSGFFSNSNSMIKAGNIEETGGNTTGGFGGGSMKRPAPNMFSRMLQISPNAKLPMGLCDSPAVVAAAASPRVLNGHPPMLVSNHDHGLISPNSSKGNCLVESQGLQISSPRNTGIKRRKSQAKKVVCIPAPAPANSRPSGEVVPSDLWAWRKYGQKPIKGSPYPRGYYRCSSSKGCSARKQVERSRTDPNMLVITYTSEHNHPWPTQRNALAGSTRATPSKNTASAAGTKDTQTQKPTNPKDEHNETTTENTTPPPPSAINAINVKEENSDTDHNHLDKNNMEDRDQFERGFPNSYKPTLPDSNQSEDNFFADLGEIEADSLDMLFTQGFSGDDGGEDKTLDPFTFYDWVGSNSTTASSSAAAAAASRISGATTSYGDPTKRDS